MLQAVDIVKRELNRMRTMEYVTNMLSEVKRTVDELNLDEIVLPRRRQPPVRFCGSAEPHHAQSTEIYYRLKFFKLVDTAQVQLTERFGVDKVGLRQYRCLEEILLTGDVSDVVDAYPEIHPIALQIELTMFRHQISYGSTTEAVLRMQEMTPEVQALFPQVKELMILLLVSPASSSSAERSFSSLRRLKTWLRNSMTQKRLNSVAVCHTHQDLLDNINMLSLCTEFCQRSDIRKNIFGVFAM